MRGMNAASSPPGGDDPEAGNFFSRNTANHKVGRWPTDDSHALPSSRATIVLVPVRLVRPAPYDPLVPSRRLLRIVHCATSYQASRRRPISSDPSRGVRGAIGACMAHTRPVTHGALARASLVKKKKRHASGRVARGVLAAPLLCERSGERDGDGRGGGMMGMVGVMGE